MVSQKIFCKIRLCRHPTVGNLVKVRSTQEEIESNMETGEERIKSRVDTEGDRTGYNLETKENGTNICFHSVETKEKGKEIHRLYADIVCGYDMARRKDRKMPHPQIRK